MGSEIGMVLISVVLVLLNHFSLILVLVPLVSCSFS